MKYAAKETSAPTEIYVPARQYPDGFFVWVSDGRCAYDPATQSLFHHPEDDAPGVEYTITLRRPQPGATAEGWRYFFRGNQAISR